MRDCQNVLKSQLYEGVNYVEILQLDKTKKKFKKKQKIVPEAAFWTITLGNKVRSIERMWRLQPFRAKFCVSDTRILNQWCQSEQTTLTVEQCPVVIYSKLKQGKGTNYGSCGTKSNYTSPPKLCFTAPDQPKVSFGTIYGIIKRFTTTRKSWPRKAPGRKLKLTDRDAHLFRRYMFKKARGICRPSKMVCKWKTKLWKNYIWSIYALIYQKM